MIVRWTLSQRIAALAVLRSIKQASLFEWRLAKEGIKVLELKAPEDFQKYEIILGKDGVMRWNEEKGKVQEEYCISNGAYNVMETWLKRYDQSGVLHHDLYDLAAEVIGFDNLTEDQKKLLEAEPVTTQEWKARHEKKEQEKTAPAPKKGGKRRS